MTFESEFIIAGDFANEANIYGNKANIIAYENLITKVIDGCVVLVVKAICIEIKVICTAYTCVVLVAKTIGIEIKAVRNNICIIILKSIGYSSI